MLKYKVVTSAMAITLMLSSVNLNNVYADNDKLVEAEKITITEGVEQPTEEGVDKDTEEKVEGGSTEETKPPVETPTPPTEGETTPPPTEGEVKPPTEEGEKLPENVIDNTQREIKDGMHMVIGVPVEQKEMVYIPSLELELIDNEGKVVSSAIANKNNYKHGEGYRVIFQGANFKVGDNFKIRLKSATKFVQSIVVETSNGAYNVKPNTYVPITVGKYVGDITKDEKVSLEVEGSKEAPLGGILKTDVSKVAIKVEDTKGNSKPNFGVNIERTLNDSTFSGTTDGEGYLWLDRDRVEPEIRLTSKDKTMEFDGWEGTQDVTIPVASKESKLETMLSVKATVREVPKEVIADREEQESTTGGEIKEEGTLNISVNSNFNTDISTEWLESEVTLEGENGAILTYNVSQTQNIGGIVEGTYKVTVKNDNAEVTYPNTINIKGETSLKLDVKPKFILEVLKQEKGVTKDHNFSVLSKSDKAYKGKGGTQFAVAQGEMFSIKDNDTSEVFTVNIAPKQGVTRLILGDGVIMGADGSTPHTRDMTLMYAGLLGASLIVVAYATYRLRGKKGTKALVSALIVGGTLMSVLPTDVYAGSGGSSGGSHGGSGGLQSDYFVVDSKGAKQVVSFGFVPTNSAIGEINMQENSSEHDLAYADKFGINTAQYMLYMPLTGSIENEFNSSGVLGADSGGYYLIRGKDTIFGNGSEYTNYHKNQLMPLPTQAQSSNNKVLKLVGNSLAPAQDIGVGQNGYNYGSSINSQIQAMGQKEKDAFFEDYLGLYSDMLTKSGEPKATVDYKLAMFREDYRKGKVSFVVNTLSRTYIQGNKSNVMYMPITEVVEAIGRGHGAGKVTEDQFRRERRYMLSKPSGYCGSGYHGQNCSLFRHISFSAWGGTKQGYTKTIQAKNKNVVPKPGTDAPDVFGGWGFFEWKGVAKPVEPNLNVEYTVALKDENGKVVGDVKGEVRDFTRNHNNTLLRIGKEESNIYRTSKPIVGSIIEKNGKKYKVQPKADVNMFDVSDNESLYKDKLNSNGTSKGKLPLKVTLGGNTVNFVPNDLFALNTPFEINKYLGGTTSNKDDVNGDYGMGSNISPSVSNKYAGKVDKDGTPKYSDAKAIIELEAIEIPDLSNKQPEEAKNLFVVPSWSMGEYWNEKETVTVNDANAKPLKAWYGLSHPIGDTVSHKVGSISPSGQTTLQLKPSASELSNELKVNAPFLKSEPKYIVENGNDNSDRVVNVQYGGTQTGVKVGSTLQATRTSEGDKKVDNIALANWKQNPQIDLIKKDMKSGGRVKSTHNYKFKQGLDDVREYTVNVPYYNHETSVTVDKDGNKQYIDNCNCYTETVKGSEKYIDATYNRDIVYMEHKTTDNKSEPIKKQELVEDSFQAEVKPQKPLVIRPEVEMVYEADDKNYVGVTTVGDRDRKVQTASYSYLRMDAQVESKVQGTSVATDTKTGKLIEGVAKGSKVSVGNGGGQVIHKGSALNTSYEIGGKEVDNTKPTLTAKTYALDIGNTALKTGWGNSGYSTDKMNEDHLSQFGEKKGSEWVFNVEMNPTMKIDGKEYKGKKKVEAIKGATNTNSYQLIVKGGELQGVVYNNVLTQVKDLPKEVQDALGKLGVLDGSAFKELDKGKGDAITEPIAKSVIEAKRGVAYKNGEGWYNEDTSVIVLREYTTTFNLPKVFVYSDKVPMKVNGLETPTDKTKFYTKGIAGHTTLEMSVAKSKAKLKYDSQLGKWSKDNKKELQYVVPNVSILDTTR